MSYTDRDGVQWFLKHSRQRTAIGHAFQNEYSGRAMIAGVTFRPLTHDDENSTKARKVSHSNKLDDDHREKVLFKSKEV